MGRLIGFGIMILVAANDGMVAVLARRMKDLHFSVMMWWFAAIGLALTLLAISVKSYINGSLPTILFYDSG
jgi:hypothetical protein